MHVLLTLGALVLAQLPPQEVAAPPLLEVRALANEGFLLSVGQDVVAIDAFLSEPYVGYAALAGEPLALLTSGAGPFESLDLALASHVHRDHFQPAPARLLLAARPACLFVSSPQVLDTLLEHYAELEQSEPAARLRDVLPEPGEQAAIDVGRIHVDVLRLSHGTGRFADIHNLGHLITLGGVTALHVGDAAMQPENFAPYRLRERGIDVAFVPYWYFDDEAGRAIIDAHFRPARLVACHIPPAELVAVTRQLAERFPDVLVPQQPLERMTFADLQD